MTRLAPPFAVAVFALALGGSALGAARPETPAIHTGRELAETVCSACHVVETNQEFPPILEQTTPSFQEIADRPGTTLGSLRSFMAHTKWDAHTQPMTMPSLMLSPDERDSLSRYILSLRTVPKPRATAVP